MTDDDKLLENILKAETNLDNAENIDYNSMDIDDILNEDTFKENPLNNNNLNFLNENVKEIQKLYNNNSDIETIKNSDIVLENLLKNSPENKTTTTTNKLDFNNFKSPIDFINYMETFYIKKQIEENDQVFQLKNYKSLMKKKVNALKFPPKTTLSSRFFKEGNIITCLAVKDEYLYAGNNIGKIRVYSSENEHEIKTLINEEISKSPKRAVVCMDVWENNYLVSGYENGFIALWDINKKYCIKLITEEHKNSCILKVKFINIVPNKNYTFLSCDKNNRINKLNVIEGWISTKVVPEPLLNLKNLKETNLFLIDILHFTDEELKMPFNKVNNIIIYLGCSNYILVYSLEPEQKKLLTINRPDYIKKEHLPDCDFGRGYVPRNSTKKYMDLIKDVSELNLIATENGININEIQRLFAISWEKYIYFYVIKYNKNTGVENILLVGHYINDSIIMRMGFLSDSIVYFYDFRNKLKLINTALCIPGYIKFKKNDNEIEPIIQNDLLYSPEIECKDEFKEILFQTFLPNNTRSYNNLLINQMNSLYFIEKKTFYYGKLLNYEQCLYNLQERSEWMEALTLGLNIYHGKILNLPEIPIEENIRKEKLRAVLKGLVYQYSIINTSMDFSSTNPNKIIEIFSKCINICIEFCIEINEVGFLLNHIQPNFDTKGYLEMFIEKLEPFILCDKIKNTQLGQITISRIISIYIKNKKYHTLSQILIHLDVQSIETEEIKYICSEHCLIPPLIYIYMNDKDENYFYPIKRIYEIYSKAIYLDDKTFISYQDYLNNNSIEELEKSKQYIGHQLLWYINLCIDGKKFLTDDIILDNNYKDLIKKIFLWLLNDKILTDLMNFDSFSLFIIFQRLFNEYSPFESIKSINYEKTLFEGILLKEKQIEKPNINIYIEILMDKSKSFKKIFINDDMYEFIIKTGINLPTLDKNIIIESITYLLQFESRQTESDKEKDEFGFHKNYLKINDKIENYSHEINHILEVYSTQLSNEELKSLLQICNNTFIKVKIYLLKLLNENSKCLDLYLNEYNLSDKIKVTFNFIEEILNSGNSNSVLQFKEIIVDRIYQLGELSSEKLIEIINKWYENDHLLVLDKLNDKPELQLNYIEKVLEKYKEDEISNKENEIEQYTNLLIDHISLLCKLKKINEILPNLKKRASYPPQECLEKCLEVNAVDASVFLYLSMGETNNALKYVIGLLKKNFSQIIESLKKNNLNEFNNILSNEYNKNIERCIEICEKDCSKNSSANQMTIWFDLVHEFYNFGNEINSLTPPVINSTNLNDLKRMISDNIQLLFDRMFPFVGIQAIIDDVSKNYKQAEFKEFKSVLSQMLKGNSYLSNIYNIVINLLNFIFEKRFDKFNKIKQLGHFFHLDKCDKCDKAFDIIENECICGFKCGHKLHYLCCISVNDIIVCPICRQKEIENKITSFIEDEKIIKKLKIKEITVNKKNNINIPNSKFNNIKTYEKLQNIDNNLFKTISIFNK